MSRDAHKVVRMRGQNKRGAACITRNTFVTQYFIFCTQITKTKTLEYCCKCCNTFKFRHHTNRNMLRIRTC